MKKVLNIILVPLILFLVSLYIILPYISPDFIMISGENIYGLNPHFNEPLFAWQDKTNFGSIFVYQNIYYIFYVLWRIFEVVSFIIHPTILFIFLGFFLSGFFFYLLCKYLFKFSNNLIYLPACLLYSINIYRVLRNSTELILLFIFLPVFFLFYHKLVEKPKIKYLAILVLISILSSSMSLNLAVFTIPYILLFTYFVYSLIYKIAKKISIKKFLTYNIFYFIALVASNLFWFITLFSFLTQYSLGTGSGDASVLWNALNAGEYFEYFRYLGFWAFAGSYSGGAYFPWHVNYYQIPIVITSFVIVFFSFIYPLWFKSGRFKKSIALFILLLSVFSFFLMSGIKTAGFGQIFEMLYNKFNFMKLYREPYSKFTPLFIFATCLGLSMSISIVIDLIKNNSRKILFIFVLSFFILLSSYRLFTYQYFIKGATSIYDKGGIFKIPQYWKQANEFIKKFKLEERIFISNQNLYADSNYNWEYGINFGSDVAISLIDKKVIKDSSENKQMLIKGIFNNSDVNLPKFLGFLGSRIILQENDLEWRLSRDNIQPPRIINQTIREKGYRPIGTFGVFTPEYLAKVGFKDKDKKLNQEFAQQLTNMPILIFYKSNNDFFNPLFYIPKNSIVSYKLEKDIPFMVSNSEFKIGSAIFLRKQNNFQNPTLSELPTTYTYDSTVEFKRINPTKYIVILHKVSGKLPFVYNDTFHQGWKLYAVDNKDIPTINQQSKANNHYQIIPGNEPDQASQQEIDEYLYNQKVSIIGTKFISKSILGTIQNNNLNDSSKWATWFKKPLISERQHLVANGFANSWLIDTNKICTSNQYCRKNKDGTYDLNLIVEFQPQKLFTVSFNINLIFLFTSCLIIILSYLMINKKINES